MIISDANEKHIILENIINHVCNEDYQNFTRYIYFLKRNDFLDFIDKEQLDLLDKIIENSKYSKFYNNIIKLKYYNCLTYSKHIINKMFCKVYDKYSEYTNYSIRNTKECMICLEEYSFLDSCIKLCCKHDYHKSCIKQWLKNNNFTCPICRTNLLENN
jgi:hypothetical protein